MAEKSACRDQIESVFFQARKLQAAERNAFLDSACRGNTELRHAVQGLLDADAGLGSFLDTPIDLGETSSVPAAEDEGSTVDRYKLLQKLGEGGFGIVFMAEQAEPVHRKVALKIIKPGMDSQAVIARFEAERQALAMMNHPNIANVLDGGTTATGRPFFVMELVRGVSITEYCTSKRLGIKDRLRLFVDLCRAVQHAHQKGIIHRDLKPSNVMVTLHDGNPVVKVIDFGVAKAIDQQLTSKTLFTRYGQMIGTPQYMSPEQAQMSAFDVDTRSDIYSLGVLLYELLAGSTPLTEGRLRQATYAEMQRIICEEDIAKPSVRLSTTAAQEATDLADERSVSIADLRRELQGDLDCIVMKTLEKERDRRYRTAIELADDITRYINNETVEARPPSLTYRAKKYVQKNRLLVTAAASILMMLVLCTITSTALAFWAHGQKTRAKVALTAEKKTRKNAEKMKTLAENQANELIGQIYETQFTRASTAYTNNNLGQTRASLAACPESSREWEWCRMNLLANSHVRTAVDQSVDDDWGASVFTNDSRHLLTCGNTVAGNEVVTWNAENGERVHTLTVGDQRLLAIAIHPKGRLVAVGDTTGTLSIVDLLSGESLWDTSAHAGSVLGLAFSPNGDRSASVSDDGWVKIWNATSGDLLASQNHYELLRSIEFDPSGMYLLAESQAGGVGRETRAVLVLDSTTGQEAKEFSDFGRPANGATFSPDGEHLAFSQNDHVIIRNVRTRQLERVLTAGPGRLATVKYSPDGRWLAAASSGSVILWDTTTGQIEKKFGGDHSIVYLHSFSPDSSKIALHAFRERGTLKSATYIYDIFGQGEEGGLTLRGFTDLVGCVAFSPDSKRVAAAGIEQSIRIWDSETCEELRVLYGHTDAIWRIAWSKDGDSLFSHDISGYLRAWNLDDGSCRWVARTTGDKVRGILQNGIDVSPDGRHVLVAWVDGEAIVFDARNGGEVTRLRGHESYVNDVACSPGGRWIATASNDRTVAIWDARTFKRCRVLKGHAISVRSVAFSPDAKFIASTGYDGTVRVWDSESGKEVHKLQGHEFGVWCAEFSANGHRLFSADGPGLIIVWDWKKNKEIFRWRHEDHGWRLDVSPDGRTIASAGGIGGDVRLWESVLPAPERVKKRKFLRLVNEVVDRANRPVALASEQAKRVESNGSITEDVRQGALKLIALRGDDPFALNRASWQIVRDGHENQYQRALDHAKWASELVPDCVAYAVTAGVAHYRMGHFQESVGLLRHAESQLTPDELRLPGDPRVDLTPYVYATLAMAQHRLGDMDLAKKSFDVAKKRRQKLIGIDPDVDRYLREAEDLLSPDSSEKQDQ